MAGAERLDEVVRFPAAHFADDDSVRSEPQAKCNEHLRSHPLIQIREQADEIRNRQLQFLRVFDRDDTLVVRDRAIERVEEGRFAGRGSARYQDVGPAPHHFGESFFQHLVLGAPGENCPLGVASRVHTRERPKPGVVPQCQIRFTMSTYRERITVDGGRFHDRGDPEVVVPRVDDPLRGSPQRRLLDGGCERMDSTGQCHRIELGVQAMHHAPLFDPDVARVVDQHFGDVRVV